MKVDAAVQGDDLIESLPLRECGLKVPLERKAVFVYLSLPLRECGLKGEFERKNGRRPFVTPLAGVWIERNCRIEDLKLDESLPLRECGLKGHCGRRRTRDNPVTPLAGVWIERTEYDEMIVENESHSPCGSVD